MRKLNPEIYGTTELRDTTARDTRGGNPWAIAGVALFLAKEALDNSDEIKEGFNDAYNPDTE